MVDPWSYIKDFLATQKLPSSSVFGFLEANRVMRNSIDEVRRSASPPEIVLFELLTGLLHTKLIGIAIDLQLADMLESGPMSTESLAESTGTNVDALRRMLGTLVSLGVFKSEKEDKFANNSISECLIKGKEGSMYHAAKFLSSDWYTDIWNHGLHTIRTGESATYNATGKHFFEFLAQNPEASEQFKGAMKESAGMSAGFIAKEYDFGRFNHVCDLGGGNSGVLLEVLDHYKRLKGMVFDLPEVIRECESDEESQKLGGRLEFVAGDFFDEVPGSCDLYMLRGVLHDWGDDACIKILENIRQALPANGVILVIEKPFPDHEGFDLRRLQDMQLLISTGEGRERTDLEYHELFIRAGFRMVRKQPLPSYDFLMELWPI